jgi:nicotinate phosphoribosyltransferase
LSHYVWYESDLITSQTTHHTDFASLTLSTDERQFLERRCPYLKPEYLDYLQQYRFKPEQVTVTFSPIPEAGEGWGNVEIEAAGPWIETIMWEVPLMACLSETYFLTDDTDWNYDGQLGKHDCFSTFAFISRAYKPINRGHTRKGNDAPCG